MNHFTKGISNPIEICTDLLFSEISTTSFEKSIEKVFFLTMKVRLFPIYNENSFSQNKFQKDMV